MGEAAAAPSVSIRHLRPHHRGDASASRFDDEPTKGPAKTLPFQGVPVPIERDRLQILVEMAAAPTFPLEHMPALFRDMVEAAHEHVQAPKSLCAQAVLSGLALAAQGLANVDVPNLPEPIPLSLFFFAVAASGERKTALDRVVQRPFAEREARLGEHYDEDMRRFRDEHMLWESERKKITADKKMSKDDKRLSLEALPEPREPTPPVLRIKEPTFEGIVNLLRKGLTSIGLFTSEGGQFLGGHGMTDDTRMRTMTGLSELWDGGTAQRIRAGEVTRVVGRRVSVSLAVQPKIAATFLGNELARDQGFLARFLVMMPESTIGTREVREAKSLDDTRIIRFHRQVTAMLDRPQPVREGSGGMELELPALAFDHDAWRLWQAFANEVEQSTGKGGMYQPIQASALKMAENVARIAGVLALFEDDEAGEIRAAQMTAAVEIGRFYLAEALRLLGHEVADPETVALNDLAAWLEIRAAFRPEEDAPLWIKARVALLEERLDTLPARDRHDVLARLDWMAAARGLGACRSAESEAACLAALRQDIEAGAVPLPERAPEPEPIAAGAWSTPEELAAAIGSTALEWIHAEPLEYVLRRGYAAMGLPPSLATEMCRRLAALRVGEASGGVVPAEAIAPEAPVVAIERPAAATGDNPYAAPPTAPSAQAEPPAPPSVAAEPVQSGQPARTREEAREAVRALLTEDLTDREIARRVGVSPSTVAAVRKASS